MTIVSVFADGGVIGSSRSTIGGMWAWAHVNAQDCRIASASGMVLPRDLGTLDVTNNVTEFLALLLCLEALPPDWRGIVHSDSWCTLQRFFLGAKLNGVPMPLTRRLGALHKRLDMANLPFVLLDGHPTRAQLAAGVGKRGRPVSVHNVWCDRACGEAGRSYLAALPVHRFTYQGVA